MYRVPNSDSNPRPPAFAASVLTTQGEGKIRFSQFTLFYRVKCEKLFCKTNLKLKSIKINKTKFNAKP